MVESLSSRQTESPPMATFNDCITLLSLDPQIANLSADDAKGWRRLRNVNHPDGIDRVFAHEASGLFAKIAEANGSIRIASLANSLDHLDQEEFTRDGQPAPKARTFASPFWPSMAPEILQADAALGIASFLNGNERAIDECDSLALANQFIFAITSEETDLGHVAIITPTSTWGKTGKILDSESPIEGLLPEFSFDLDGRGAWSIIGFETPTDLALHLLAAGFVWEKKLQNHADRCSGDDGMEHMLPILSGRGIKKSATQRSTSF